MFRGLALSHWARRGLAGVGAVLLAASLVFAAAGAAAASAAPVSQSVQPSAFGELDCNGFSPAQQAVSRKLLCTDIRGLWPNQRFYDNGHYIGHDEPSIRFLSQKSGSGNDVTFTEQLPRDPSALPTTVHPGRDVTHWFELTPAPWFGMTICDPNSFPLVPCTPNSDANAPSSSLPDGTGGAFMEMQFYPPGFAPFADSVSCDNTHWCAALNIDSLEANANKQLNNNCVEPVNFAFIQTNGVPAGPPSPQLSDLSTFTPNSKTLLMNPGDVLRTHIFDASLGGGQHALKVTVDDLTTGQGGFMIASAANGFMNTSFVDCSGHPFNFQPMYSTAAPQNSITWSVLESGILNEFEIGHFEPCTSVTQAATLQLGPAITDTTWLTCHGPYEAAGASDTSSAGQEPTDALCYPQGDTHGGLAPPNEVTGCLDDLTQNGDLDFDGTPYYAHWPNSLTAGPFPTPVLQQQPKTVGGSMYPQLEFETDAPASELTTCSPSTPNGCAVPPPNSPGQFYPFWTQAMVGGQCVWEFGHMQNGNTFGGDAQYAQLVPHGFFSGQFDLSSPPLKNPQCS